VLKALNRLRELSPQLKYDDRFVTEQIMSELRFYFQLTAALEPFRSGNNGHKATNLLQRTIEERLKQTLDRIFRLLGLKYPPKEIYSAYIAVRGREADQVTAAIEFLDHVLERELKRVLLPLLDAPDHILERKDLIDVESKDIESALRDLIVSPDPWLSACAMAAAAELRIRRLAPEIAEAGKRAEPDIYQVAQSAAEALAGA
jgi:AAA family ATP:ADP antiporter